MSINAPPPHPSTPYESGVGTLGHDLRTSLAVIRVQAQMLIRLLGNGASPGHDQNAQLIQGLKRIDAAVTTLNSAIDSFVDTNAVPPSESETPEVH